MLYCLVIPWVSSTNLIHHWAVYNTAWHFLFVICHFSIQGTDDDHDLSPTGQNLPPLIWIPTLHCSQWQLFVLPLYVPEYMNVSKWNKIQYFEYIHALFSFYQYIIEKESDTIVIMSSLDFFVTTDHFNKTGAAWMISVNPPWDSPI